MNIKGILFISFVLLIFSLAAASASDLGHVAISDSHSDSSIAHVPVTVSSHDDSVIIDDNLDDVAVDDSSIDDGQSVPDDDSAIDDGDKSIPADGDDDKPIHVDPQDDIDGDINDGDSIIINITNDTPKNNYNDKPISNVKEAWWTFDDLQSLIDYAPKGTHLFLYHDYMGKKGQQVQINKDLVIDGQGNMVDGDRACRIFYSTSGNIVLRNIRIMDGDYDTSCADDKTNNGAAIWIGGDAKYTIENCQFLYNWADDMGGAIYNGGNNNLIIRDCVFKGNSVGDVYGGAIYSNGEVYIINSKFEENSALHQGGAIYVDGNSKASSLSKIINCTFICNTINLEDDFRSTYGGAIRCNQNLFIENSTFKSNGEGSDSCGGAVSCNLDLTVVNSLFDSNLAESRGGAIEGSGITSLTNCTFKNNKVDGVITSSAQGGAIRANLDLYINNCTFDHNYADDLGGAVSAGRNLYVNYFQDEDEDYNTFFYGNIADDCEAGAISCEGTAYIINTLFDSNKAWTDGGAIFSHGQCFITHCLFKSNKCAGALSQCEGGAIYGKADLTIKNCIFHDNYAEDDGGALYCEELIQIYNSTFEGNTAEDYGGAVYSEMSVKINPATSDCLCHFINNRALDDKGGAIYADDGVYGYNASFISNTAYVDGGAIFSHVVDLDNCSFYYNRAEGAVSKCYGGAVRAYTAKVFNCIFRENYSENHGGAIFTNTFSDDVKNCTFYFNQAGEDGGAIYINKENDVLFTQCTFIINRCLDQGGAIYADSCSSKISLSNNLFKGNHAETEGHVVFNYGYFGEILNNWWADNIPTEQNGLLVEHKYLSSNINHVDSDPLRLAISCPSALTVGKTARATLYFVKSDGSAFTGEIPLLMEFVLPSEYNVVSSGTTMNSVWIDFMPEKAGKFTISGDLFGELVNVTSTVTEDSISAGNSVASGFANSDSSMVKNAMVNTQFAKSLCDFPQSHNDFNFYSPWLLILSIFGL